MNKLTRTAISATFFLLAGSSVIAADLTKAEYDTAKLEATAKYKADRTACKTLSGNAKDICVEEAKGQEKVTNASLKDQFTPSVEHRYALRMAKADAAYNVAKEKCDDAAGNAKDVCRKEAKSAYVSAKADAKLAEKTSDAKSTATEKVTEARKDASAEKRDAAWAVAKEKCDAMAGDTKTNCLKDAKANYGTP